MRPRIPIGGYRSGATVLIIAAVLLTMLRNAGAERATTATTPVGGTTASLLPGQHIWTGGVSSFLFGSNDSEEWGPDNVETDPHHIIQPSMKAAHMQLERTFIFHYSLRDGHRTTLGPQARGQSNLHPSNPHEYDQPAPPANLYTPAGYEVENRVQTIEHMGAACLVVFPDIWTTPTFNADPNSFHRRIIDPDTGRPETDLDFARKVVAYLGSRCNLYEIGNEPDLDTYTASGVRTPHMPVTTYVERWTEFVHALRLINHNAKFIGPVTYNDHGNDCGYTAGTPYRSSQPGDCYMRNFLHGVAGTNVEPDAVSFHWYPCSNATDGFHGKGNCGPVQAQSYATVVNEVRGWVQKDLGHLVPLGISEWNFDPGPGKNAPADNAGFMVDFTRSALNAMISAKLAFANQFDTQNYGGWCHLDMFDSCTGTDRPKAQFTIMAALIRQYMPRASGTRAP